LEVRAMSLRTPGKSTGVTSMLCQKTPRAYWSDAGSRGRKA
jgi:hypothetical protein